jgi:hypothetical protein
MLSVIIVGDTREQKLTFAANISQQNSLNPLDQRPPKLIHLSPLSPVCKSCKKNNNSLLHGQSLTGSDPGNDADETSTIDHCAWLNIRPYHL